MRIELTAHSFDPKARGVIGDTLELPDEVAESIIARGGAKRWMPAKEKPKTDKERLAILEAKVASLESMTRTGIGNEDQA